MVILINPNLIVQRNDPFTTGIVYMPVGLAYIAASLRKSGIPIKVIDAFAEKPFNVRFNEKFMILGITHDEIIERIPENTKVIFVYAINLTNHMSSIGIVSSLKKAFPDIPIVILENTQAVTAYSLKYAALDFYKAGALYMLLGEGEKNSVQLANALINNKKDEIAKIEGLASRELINEPVNKINNLDELPFPAWDLFPLENYWDLRFAHGPQSTQRYLPLLTSRGCPYSCRFCVAPETNKQKWRSRKAENVVDEMEFYLNNYNVNEFHLEDINPTVSDERIRDICNEILKRKLKIIWKIVAGTKVETIKNEETIDLMAKAGCRYISISPETGSKELLKLMNKPFDLEHAVKLVKRMNKVGIRSQVCFVLGFPGESKDDLIKTETLIRDLTYEGADEIALFIITPVPGSEIFGKFSGYNSLSELNFSPAWREDYISLSDFRLRLYGKFLLWKIRYHPLKIILQSFNFLRRRFETKMEMVPYRAIVYKLLDKKSGKNRIA